MEARQVYQFNPNEKVIRPQGNGTGMGPGTRIRVEQFAGAMDGYIREKNHCTLRFFEGY